MTRMRLMSRIRKQDYYKPMLDALEECGVEQFDISPPTGRGHPMLHFEHGGVKHRVPLPGSPSSHSEAIKYVPAFIRRRVRGEQ